MSYFIDAQGSYYEGDRAHALDIEVPQRPSPSHVWKDGTWYIDPVVAHNEPIDAKIAAIEDAASPTKRGAREATIALALLCDMVNQIVGNIEASVNELRASAGLTPLAAGRLPDLKKNKGMAEMIAADSAIKPLRQERIS